MSAWIDPGTGGELVTGIMGGALLGGLLWRYYGANISLPDDGDGEVAKEHLDVRRTLPADAPLCRIIEQCRQRRWSPLQQQVSSLLEQPDLVIRSLQSITESEYQQRVRVGCQCCRQSRQLFVDSIFGLFVPPRTIFIDIRQSSELQEETLIHELIHYYNYHEHPGLTEYEDELAAYRAEQEYHGKVYLTRQFDRRLGERVAEICRRTDCANEHSSRSDAGLSRYCWYRKR